ncbi:hypothetical protein [Gorillibacterium timonense]|uniref:hypothetical protein n=1 Tax=Gorillibacterium timonense TaxID=1689269 RepID=UPI00071DCC81|nr:hypothetical protein [Gorillibacterium timonense]
MKTFTRGMSLVALILAFTLLPLPGTAAPAHAGAFSRIKSFFQLPGEVDKLQDNYQQIQDQYEDTRQELESTRKQAEETALKAQQTAEELLAEQERLAKENALLAEENRQLAVTLEELKNTNELRQKANRRLRTALYTGAGLIAAAFLAGRFTRFALRKGR